MYSYLSPNKKSLSDKLINKMNTSTLLLVTHWLVAVMNFPGNANVAIIAVVCSWDDDSQF